MSASADVLALASAEFDVSNVTEGSTITVKWRGKPIFIRHRTAHEIEKESTVNVTTLRHQEADSERYQMPEWLLFLKFLNINILFTKKNKS
jgi:ubiquinol-cytochrome c reductase iron-sulfur subunit